MATSHYIDSNGTQYFSKKMASIELMKDQKATSALHHHLRVAAANKNFAIKCP